MSTNGLSPKGKQVNIPAPRCGICGNTIEIGNICKSPRKSYLFFLTDENPGMSLARDWVACLAELSFFVWSGVLLTILENPMEIVFTHSAVLITAAGLQGEQPLVDRIM
jgi:hypothetical protein